jgi:hypothetical protein
VLKRRPFSPLERAIAWAFAVVLFTAGASGVALGLHTHAPGAALAGLAVWGLGALYAHAAHLGRPL